MGEDRSDGFDERRQVRDLMGEDRSGGLVREDKRGIKWEET